MVIFREYVIEEDFMKAVREIAENKKPDTKLDYNPVQQTSLRLNKLW